MNGPNSPNVLLYMTLCHIYHASTILTTHLWQEWVQSAPIWFCMIRCQRLTQG